MDSWYDVTGLAVFLAFLVALAWVTVTKLRDL